jgi:hypothetical protein
MSLPWPCGGGNAYTIPGGGNGIMYGGAAGGTPFGPFSVWFPSEGGA